MQKCLRYAKLWDMFDQKGVVFTFRLDTQQRVSYLMLYHSMMENVKFARRKSLMPLHPFFSGFRLGQYPPKRFMGRSDCEVDSFQVGAKSLKAYTTARHYLCAVANLYSLSFKVCDQPPTERLLPSSCSRRKTYPNYLSEIHCRVCMDIYFLVDPTLVRLSDPSLLSKTRHSPFHAGGQTFSFDLLSHCFVELRNAPSSIQTAYRRYKDLRMSAVSFI